VLDILRHDILVVTSAGLQGLTARLAAKTEKAGVAA
jgi:hypothetical protein